MWQFTYNVSDTGMAVLVLFIHHTLKLLSSVSNTIIANSWIASFPNSLESLRSTVINDSISYAVYVVCAKCHSLYDYKDCLIKSDTSFNVLLCKHKEFPSHPVSSFRKSCGVPLLRTLSRRNHFLPFKSYPYQSLKDAIVRLLKRVGFLEKCEHWRARTAIEGYYGDVYDGRVWREEFQSFLSQKHSWTICFSSVALKEILPGSHLKYWLLFVKACSLLSSRVLKKSNVHLAHQYLTMFCKEFETVNGKQHCTPNMHLHLHLEDCILDYGPLYAFWCYAFERYNGMLEGFPTNLRSIEPQLMKKCLLLQEIHSQSFPDEGQIFETLLTHKATNCGGLAIAMTGEDTSRELELSHPTLKKI